MNRFACSALVLSALTLVACSSEESGDPLQKTAGAASTAPAPEQPKEEAPAAPARAAAETPSDVAAVDDSMDVEARSWGVNAGVMINGHFTGLMAGRTVEVSFEDGTRSVEGIIKVEGPLGSSVTIERNSEQFRNATPGDFTVELGAETTWTVTVTGPFGRKWGGRPWSYAYDFKVSAAPGDP